MSVGATGRQNSRRGGVPPPPFFCYEYQNKGVKSADFAKNIILKDLTYAGVTYFR